jgi:UDP-N-acetylmuramoylalanine--D-glutamate ligase
VKTAVDYTGRSVLVMGLGSHGGGVGIARFLASRGATVTVTDLRSEEELRPSVSALAELPIQFVLGEHRESDFRRVDMIVRNPGVPLDSPFLATARQSGVPIEMEMGLFFSEWPPQRTIGVTGTRGKTTTATFIHHLLKVHGADAVLAGNMRVSAVGMLDDLQEDQTVVLELSSWQLEGLDKHQISPAVAIVTNVLPDHLDRYEDMTAYAAAKKIIVQHQKASDLAILNRENVHSRSFAAATPAEVRWFSHGDEIAGWERARISGDHNRANLAAGILSASKFDISESTVERAIETFPGVPYRQDLVAVINGVSYVNDSTATTPDATLAALATLHGRMVLIAGGSDKGLSYLALATRIESLGERVGRVILLKGAGTDVLEPLLISDIWTRAEDMDDAVQQATDIARSGDTVLLSPACASFGQFANEFDRGDRFNQAVERLKD